MALPKKKGIRKLTVGDTRYYWTARYDYPGQRLVITVGLAERPTMVFYVFLNQQDPWLACPEPVKNEVGPLTPKFIRRSIEFTLDQTDWPEGDRVGFTFRDGKYLRNSPANVSPSLP